MKTALTTIFTLVIINISNAQSLLNSNILQKNKISKTNSISIDKLKVSSTENNIAGDSVTTIVDTIYIIKSSEINPSSEEGNKWFDFFQASPNFLSMLNQETNFVPNFDILLTNKTNDSSNNTYSFKIFTGSASIDTTIKNNALRLILPEASKLGFKLNYIKPFKLHKTGDSNQAVSIDLNFLYKDFPIRKDTQIIGTANSLVFHGKLGFEKVVLKNMFSLYGNLNYIYILTGVDNMKELFNKSNNNYLFWDCGFKMLFDINNDKRNLINIDFGIIPVNGEIFKLYNSTHDNVIPTLRIGYAKKI